MIAKDKPDALAHRQVVRPTHLKHLDGLGEKLVFAGPFQDDAGQSTGSFVVIEADSLDAAKATFASDPFVTEGVATASVTEMAASFASEGLAAEL